MRINETELVVVVIGDIKMAEASTNKDIGYINGAVAALVTAKRRRGASSARANDRRDGRTSGGSCGCGCLGSAT